MAVVQTVQGDLSVNGALTVTGPLAVGTATLDNTHIKASAKIEATKVKQYGYVSGSQLGLGANDTIPIGWIRRNASITKVTAGHITAATGTTDDLDIDFQVDGVSVLSGGTPIDFGGASSRADGEGVDGTLKTDSTVVIDPGTEQGLLTVVLTNATVGDGSIPIDSAFTVEYTTNE